MTTPTVFIVDDDEAFRDSVKELLSSVGLAAETFGSALEFLAAYDPARPGCLVLDVRMAHMTGPALQAKLKSMAAPIPIVFVSGHGDIATAVNAIKAGAVDFVQKTYHEQQLLDAINEALRRDAAQRASGEGSAALAERIATLTAREREVLELALKGLSSKLIAKELAISHRTVEQYRSRLLEKLGVGSMTELMRLAVDRAPGEAGP
jgi:RNA polymerase sigma factor (sigma-70 family)